jgi:hypothetical protein
MRDPRTGGHSIEQLRLARSGKLPLRPFDEGRVDIMGGNGGSDGVEEGGQRRAFLQECQ